MSGVVIRIEDLTPHHCAWGIRAWWRLHDLDFKDFMANGVTSEVLLATGDALALEAVRRKLDSLETQNGQ